MEIKGLQTVTSFPVVDQGDAEIRLLILLPSTVHAAPIHCSYAKTSLNNSTNAANDVPYETVSYVWGHGAHDQTITIDGEPVRVSLVVLQMLRRLRHRARRRTLWIDALCIDQSNLQEKGSQVKLMHHIYKQCTRCLIWLGSLEQEGRDEVAVSLSSALDLYTFIRWLAGEGSGIVQWLAAGFHRRPAFFTDAARALAVIRALKAFMALPWWTRIWTVQECALPPDALVYWGDDLAPLPWGTLQAASDRFVSSCPRHTTHALRVLYAAADAAKPTPTSLGNDAVDLDGALLDFTAPLRGVKISVGGEHPLDLLWRWRFRDATDPRDKVYGLMGICASFSPQNATLASSACDYTLSVATLYTRTAVELIKLYRDLRPLMGRGGEPARLAAADVPSWVVDWQRAQDRWDDYWEKRELWNNFGFCADLGLRRSRLKSGRCFSEDSRVLFVDGVFVDRVALVEDVGEDVHSPSLKEASVRHERWCELVVRYEWERRGGEEEDERGEKSPSRSWRPVPENWQDILQGFLAGQFGPSPANDDSRDNSSIVSSESWRERYLGPLALFITEEGHLGLGPHRATPGQEVWALGGSKFLMLLEPAVGLRACKDGEQPRGHYPSPDTGLEKTFYCECLVYGMMMGEAVTALSRKPVELRLV